MNLREIAEQAGVSCATVSLVLNNKKGVGAARRREITRLLLENGYTIAEEGEERNRVRRSVRFLQYTRHAQLVHGNPGFVPAIIDSVEQECRLRKYDLLIASVDCAQDIARFLVPREVGGILLLGTELDEQEAPFLREAQVPLVVVDNAVASLDCAAVTMNNRAAIFSAVEHLVLLGHRRIAFLANARPGANCEERRLAFLEAAGQWNLQARNVFPVAMGMDGARACVLDLFRRGTRFPSAVIANNDAIAVGAIRAFLEAGLSVPEDISVVGFDDIPFSGAFHPPLTTVSVPCREIGATAVRMLLERVRDPLQPPYMGLLCTNLIVSASTLGFSRARVHPNLLQ